ncbi:hypothetical protein Ccel_3419 [Ruminiclostridium cellulolyticum H10]|uniref:Uncharacterized protein n=1 Tax=Ruminiclostridium cellulolyticum (strain ATCC 35319 / DSM 5812 / JCM 6584 / H10) TaxID=394503 RepID=B8I1S2_RUMCH|nr:hypothetical protein Ccel_3419 [Ruminiclostridium cellulolyticum H10]
MKQKSNMILGLYDLVLAIAAIVIGLQMLQSNSGIFSEYPKEWLYKLPFTSWVQPGIIAILLFGAGNIFSAIMCFKNSFNMSWLSSALVGLMLLLCVITQVTILGEWYLPSVEFFAAGVIQIFISIFALATRKFS